jgi:hypothetical protein
VDGTRPATATLAAVLRPRTLDPLPDEPTARTLPRHGPPQTRDAGAGREHEPAGELTPHAYATVWRLDKTYTTSAVIDERGASVAG